jgi:hypothetical protein
MDGRRGNVKGRLKRLGIVIPGPASRRLALSDAYLPWDWAGCGYQYL